MPLFRRETPSASHAGAVGASESAPQRRLTLIAAGTRLQGEVSGATEVLVEGEVVGELRVDAAVTVGADGVVEGPISAPVVRVGGRVVGPIQATDRVEVLATGSVEGNISAPRVLIAEGAFFKGRVEMTGDKGRDSSPPQPKAVPEPAGS